MRTSATLLFFTLIVNSIGFAANMSLECAEKVTAANAKYEQTINRALIERNQDIASYGTHISEVQNRIEQEYIAAVDSARVEHNRAFAALPGGDNSADQLNAIERDYLTAVEIAQAERAIKFERANEQYSSLHEASMQRYQTIVDTAFQEARAVYNQCLHEND